MAGVGTIRLVLGRCRDVFPMWNLPAEAEVALAGILAENRQLREDLASARSALAWKEEQRVWVAASRGPGIPY